MRVPADFYLDRRDGRWVTLERVGLIAYDPVSRLVDVNDDLRPVLDAMTAP